MQDFQMTGGGGRREGCHHHCAEQCSQWVAVQPISVAQIRENYEANSVQKLLAKHLLVAVAPG